MTQPQKRVRLTINRHVKKEEAVVSPSNTPTKQKQEIAPEGGATVIETKPGTVTFLDKIKAYYHTLITVVGGILVVLNQVLPATHIIPGYGTQAAGYVSAAIVFLTALVNALKSNETWVNAL